MKQILTRIEGRNRQFNSNTWRLKDSTFIMDRKLGGRAVRKDLSNTEQAKPETSIEYSNAAKYTFSQAYIENSPVCRHYARP